MLLDFEVAPAGYRDDGLACLGPRRPVRRPGRPVRRRVPAGARVLDLLDAHLDAVAPLAPPDTAARPRDGGLRRWLSRLP